MGVTEQGIGRTGTSARVLAAGASVVSGLAWLAVEFGGSVWDENTSATYCSTSADYLVDAVFAIATTSTAIALFCLSAMLRNRVRWLALAGSVGVLASGFGSAVEHCVAEPFFLVFVAGLMTYLLATAALALTLLRTGELGRWTALFLGITAVGLMLGFERSGAAVIGAGWLGVGASLVFAPKQEAPTASSLKAGT